MEKIEQILEELFMIDPALKNRSTEIRQVVALMLKERPQTDINPDFFIELRSRLADKISEQPRFMIKKFVWPVVALAGVGSLLLLVVLNNNYFSNQGLLSSQIYINSLSDNYFGKISSDNQKEMFINNTGNIAAARGVLVNTIPPVGISKDLAVNQKMIVPDNPIKYKMVYQGEEIRLAASQGAVYRKSGRSQSGQELAKQIQKLGFGFIDLKKFTNAKLDSLSLKEDRQNGYVFSANLENNSFSIYQNWEKWPQPSETIKKEELPDRDAIISVAKDFAKEYKIDLSLYGQPQMAEVSKMAIVDYQSGRSDYAPESATVVFPFIIDKQVVYSNDGSVDGLTFEVDLRRRVVINASGNFSINLEKSNYELENDNQKIKTALTKVVQVGYEVEGAREVEVIFGSPKKILTKIYNYNTETNESYELFVPALMFPVINQVDGYYQKQVIIPLVKDLAD
ncbi:MAG TPA: hypothetical protein PKN62_00735 [bacterium]|nr:hypothetical protein [bacterium]